MRKFLGGILDAINLNNKNLETVVGGINEAASSMDQVMERERLAEQEQRQMTELQAMVKNAKKEITMWHTRATTEPGFMAPPIEEDDGVNPALKKFLEQKAIEDAKEAEKEREEEEAKKAAAEAGGE